MLPVHHQKRIYDPKIYAFDERLQHYWAQSLASEMLAGDELNSDITVQGNRAPLFACPISKR